VFASNITPDEIIARIQILTGKKIDVTNTLLIFDEVQEVPRALTSLKYFCENAPQYHVIAAGSLLGIALHQGTSFPVGKVSFLDMYPLTFREFLLAIGKESYVQPIVDCDFSMLKGLKFAYEEMLKQYFIIGGMPAVVSDFALHRDYVSARKLQYEILDAYDQDISKHASPVQVPRMRALYASIPKQLSKEHRKFVYAHIKKGARSREYELALLWLSDCGLVHKVNKSDAIYPLKAFEDVSSFKIYLSDVGLLSAISGLDQRILLSGSDIFDASKGAITEQYVLAELIAGTKYRPNYWSNDRGNAEVDFVIQTESAIVPIEVKSGIDLQAKSLKFYMEKYKTDTAIRTSLADYKQSEVIYEDSKGNRHGKVIDIPLYGIAALPDVLKRQESRV
jgi:predicted AAA+ superfamily ATPase